MEHKSPNYTKPFSLVPINFQDQDDVDELLRQRKICGWEYSMTVVEKWKDMTLRGVLDLWWIETPAPSSEEQSKDYKPIKVGHVGLTAEIFPPDPDLARSDRSVMTVKSFFILPEYRSGGLGRAVWQEVEGKAAETPQCREIAIDTLDRRHIFEDHPDWKGKFDEVGLEVPKGLITEDWYVRMGYQKFKSAPRYQVIEGGKFLTAVFLRKYIK